MRTPSSLTKGLCWVFVILGFLLPAALAAQPKEKTGKQEKRSAEAKNKEDRRPGGKKSEGKTEEQKGKRNSSGARSGSKKSSEALSKKTTNTSALESNGSSDAVQVTSANKPTGDTEPTAPPEIRFDEGSITEEALLKYFPKYLHPAVREYAAQDYESTLETLAKTKKPDSKEYPDKYHLLRGICQVKLGEFDLAIQSLNRSLEFRGSNSDTLYFLAIAHYQKEHARKALDLLYEAVWFGNLTLVAPETCYLRIAFIYGEHELPEQAEATLLAAVANTKNIESSSAELGRLFLAKGDKPNAVRHLGKAASGAAPDPRTRILFARALLMDADRALNKKDIQSAKTIASDVLVKAQDEPIDPTVERDATEVFIQSLIDNGELPVAKTTLKKAQRKFPNDPSLIALAKQLDIEQIVDEQLKLEEDKKKRKRTDDAELESSTIAAETTG